MSEVVVEEVGQIGKRCSFVPICTCPNRPVLGGVCSRGWDKPVQMLVTSLLFSGLVV